MGIFFWTTFGLAYHGWAFGTARRNRKRAFAEIKQGINGAKMAGGAYFGLMFFNNVS